MSTSRTPHDAPERRQTSARLTAIRELVGRIPDPEIPVVTLADLGILRDVIDEDDAPTVLLTPTYNGCPATEAIAAQVRDALDAAGFTDARVRTVLSPAWTTDWIGDDARRKLREYGIAPPACMAGAAAVATDRAAPAGAGIRMLAPMLRQPQPACPRCGSADVESISHWGSTPCKAHYRCLACREPFDYFKPY